MTAYDHNYRVIPGSCDCPTCDPDTSEVSYCDDDCREPATIFLKVQAGKPGSWYKEQYCKDHSFEHIGVWVSDHHMNAVWHGDTVVITDRESKI